MKKVVVILMGVILTTLILQSCAPTNPFLIGARISMGRQDYQAAQRDLDSVLIKEPNNVEALFYTGVIHYNQENWVKMYENLSKVKTLDSLYKKSDVDNMYFQAFYKLIVPAINDKYAKAVKLLKAEVVEAEQAEKVFISALKDLELADKIKNDNFDTKYTMAAINLQLGNKDKATSLFNDAITIGIGKIGLLDEEIKKEEIKELKDPKVVEAKQKELKNIKQTLISCYTNLYVLYTEKNEALVALEMLNKVLEFDPDNKEALLQMAKYYENTKDFEKALPLYDKLLVLDPTNVDILFNQGIMLKNNNNMDKAIANFEKIIEINPNDSETMYFLAMFYNEKGLYQKVVTLIEPKYESFSDEYKVKITDYIQIALVKVGRAKDAKKYMKK